MKLTDKDQVRFWAKVQKARGCWVWQSALNNKGYGQFHLGGGSRHVLAHRVAFVLGSGRPIPSGHVIMHACDNPSCVRFSHLKLGTQAENQADMARKRRCQVGEAHHRSKLKEVDVRAIRKRAEEGYSHGKIAKTFQVSRSLVSMIVRRDRWAHVE